MKQLSYCMLVLSKGDLLTIASFALGAAQLPLIGQSKAHQRLCGWVASLKRREVDDPRRGAHESPPATESLPPWVREVQYRRQVRCLCIDDVRTRHHRRLAPHLHRTWTGDGARIHTGGRARGVGQVSELSL